MKALSQPRVRGIEHVLLDRAMPGLNGVDPLSQIRREIPSVAVIVMASALDNAGSGRPKLAGTLGLLKKPFYPTDVDTVLKRYYGLQ